MNYICVYTDSSGETHFEDLEATYNLVDYAPPAPPLFASALKPALQYGMIRIEPGWYGDWHPVARRQLHIYVEGEIEAEVSDGEVRRGGPGTVVLMEDTTGKGHRSQVVGDKPVVIAVVLLPE